MPKQPLRNVIRGNHPIEIGPRTFAKRPKLAAYVAQTIAGWAQVELSLALVLARYTSRNIEQSVDMYLSIDGFGAQSLLLEAAARSVLPQDNFELFDATMRFIKNNYTIRNEMAHWTWGVTDALPDALVIIEPRSHKKLHALQFNIGDQDMSKAIPRLMALAKEQEKNVFVYRERDLARCAEDMFNAEIFADRLQQLRSTEADIAEGRRILLRRNEIQQAYENNVRRRFPRGTMLLEARWSSDVY
jgi:hypothetical protein